MLDRRNVFTRDCIEFDPLSLWRCNAALHRSWVASLPTNRFLLLDTGHQAVENEKVQVTAVHS